MRDKQRTGLVTLLFTDIVNSTGLKQQLGDHASGALFDRHHQLIRTTLAEFPEGREIETAGDSFLIVFSTPSDAVKFAVVVQERLRTLREETKAALQDRIGVHLGEVVIREDRTGARARDLYGIQIDICSRIMSLAKAGQILLTQAVFDSARQVLKGDDARGPLDWMHHGLYRLQGLDEPVAVCEVRTAGAAAVGAPTSSEKAQRLAGDEEVLGWRPAIGQPVPGTRWVLEGKLGAGGFGEVWLGRHLSTKDTRVFKFCFQAERVRYLKRELTLFRLLKDRVGSHENIVRLHDVYLDQPPFYVEMDYVEGKDLRSWCEAQGGIAQVPLETRLEIVAQVADALAAAHEAGIVHRDVKPANILVAGSAASQRAGTVEVKLTDFGIGQVVSQEYLEGITRAGFTQTLLAESSSSHIGTQLYMAPELLAGQPATVRADIYSLAVVLYQLLAQSFSAPVTSDWAERIEHPLLRVDLRSWLAGEPERRPASAKELAGKLRSLPARRRDFEAKQRRTRFRRVLQTSALSGLILALTGTAAWLFVRGKNVRWVQESAIPEITRLADSGQSAAALELAERAEPLLPADLTLSNLVRRVSTPVTIRTEPPGAVIQLKGYDGPEQSWRTLGTTPIEQRRVANGYYRWRIAKAGYETVERAAPVRSEPLTMKLDESGALPPGMISIAGGDARADSLAEPGPERLAAFLIDKFEVSNRQFKQFVESGGYQTTNHWLIPFSKAGQPITWAEAMALFRDTTGEPGPSTWSKGSYPAGQDDYPVTGVSWYEAAAYAHFAGKELPSVFHWSWAAYGHDDGDWISINPATARLSNFSGNGPSPAGHYQGMSPSGTCDMAGNAREWCWNESTAGTRCMMGGAWSDPNYLFYEVDTSDPLDRLPTRGFRCMKSLAGTPSRTALARVTKRTVRDYDRERPVSDEVFQAYKKFFDYEKTPLEAAVLSVQDSSAGWRKEKVIFNSADPREKIPAYLFLPKNARPPFQTIIVFPHSGALAAQSSETNLESMAEITDLVQSGRAVFHPVYKGTYERYVSDAGWTGSEYREAGIATSKEFRRALDYLGTRPEIDMSKLVYFGTSLGAWRGPVLLALDDRLKGAILLVGGLPRWTISEVLDPINYAPHVTVPILMLNGRHDSLFPLETSQLPLQRFLGTPREHLRAVLRDGGHEFPRSETKKETLAWLTEYFGRPLD